MQEPSVPCDELIHLLNQNLRASDQDTVGFAEDWTNLHKTDIRDYLAIRTDWHSYLCHAVRVESQRLGPGNPQVSDGKTGGHSNHLWNQRKILLCAEPADVELKVSSQKVTPHQQIATSTTASDVHRLGRILNEKVPCFQTPNDQRYGEIRLVVSTADDEEPE
jgi:hypothetical protein